MPTILLVDNDPLQASISIFILESRFSDVQRVSDPAEALCLVEQPLFAGKLGLVIAGHHSAGFGGPEFVAELQSRMPALPILVIGNGRDAARDYPGSVCFRLRPISGEELLGLSSLMLAGMAA